MTLESIGQEDNDCGEVKSLLTKGNVVVEESRISGHRFLYGGGEKTRYRRELIYFGMEK